MIYKNVKFILTYPGNQA